MGNDAETNPTDRRSNSKLFRGVFRKLPARQSFRENGGTKLLTKQALFWSLGCVENGDLASAGNPYESSSSSMRLGIIPALNVGSLYKEYVVWYTSGAVNPARQVGSPSASRTEGPAY